MITQLRIPSLTPSQFIRDRARTSVEFLRESARSRLTHVASDIPECPSLIPASLSTISFQDFNFRSAPFRRLQYFSTSRVDCPGLGQRTERSKCRFAEGMAPGFAKPFPGVPDDGDMRVSLKKAQCRQLAQTRAVEGDLDRRNPMRPGAWRDRAAPVGRAATARVSRRVASSLSTSRRNRGAASSAGAPGGRARARVEHAPEFQTPEGGFKSGPIDAAALRRRSNVGEKSRKVFETRDVWTRPFRFSNVQPAPGARGRLS